MSRSQMGDIDVLDLKASCNNANSIEIVRRRRTQELISADINDLTGQMEAPVKATKACPITII